MNHKTVTMSLEPTLTVVATGKDILPLLKVLSESGLGHLLGGAPSEPKNDFDKRDPLLIEEKVGYLEPVVVADVPVYKDNQHNRRLGRVGQPKTWARNQQQKPTKKRKRSGPIRPFTADEVIKLKEMAPTHTVSKAAKTLGVPYRKVYQWALYHKVDFKKNIKRKK